MSIFIKNLINQKLNELTLNELLFYSEQYGFSLNHSEAEQILMYIKNNKIDPFDQYKRKKLFQDLVQITDQATANKAQNLFDEIITSYGLDDLFT